MAKRAGKNSREAAARPAHGAAAVAAPAFEPEAWTCARLAQELGLTEDELEQQRRLICIDGEDFILGPADTVFTATGIKKIREHFGVSAPVQAPAAPAPALHREDLRLTRVFRWSTNVLAETDSGLEVVLTVRSIAHLEPGMILRDCIRGVMGWTYEGRLPRTIGERQLYHLPRLAAQNDKL